MRAPVSWLKEYVDIDIPPVDLAHRLTMAGAEVGAMETVGGWEHTVVGEVVAVEPHPQADRLRLATVNLGKESLTVVCGAPNVAAGQKVPFARVGAELTDPDSGKTVKLKKVKIRGVESAGMVCSERELGISDRHEGIMVLPPDAPVGISLSDYMGDTILDLDITPNRPDLLSVLGIAREVAALTGKRITPSDTSYEETGEPIDEKASVEIIDPDLCPRYCASLITDVKIGPSPPWMEQRLIAAGMRPINNIVDVTNYVMLEFGQPLHAFDFENIADRRIIVRRASDEKMHTLDGTARDLSNDMLVIADGMGPVAVAGVMGGAESEVTEATTSILLESANFNPASIRRTSSAFKLRSEASLRFEKGLSPDLPLPALKRATQLIAELSGGRIARGVIDVYPGKQASKPVSLTARQVERILGVSIPIERITSILESLNFGCTQAGSEGLTVEIPYWRTDVGLAEDLVEEIARIIGYDELPTTLPSGAMPEFEPDPIRTLKEQTRDILVGCGMQEVITYSLTSSGMLNKIAADPTPLKVANPITLEQEYLRTTLQPGLLKTLSANEKHEEDAILLFEVGKVYLPRKEDLPQEREMACGVLCGNRFGHFWRSEGELLDFFDVKGIAETLIQHLGATAAFTPSDNKALTPGRQAAIVVESEKVGTVGELHPRVAENFDISTRPVCLFQIDLEKLLPATTTLPVYHPIPRFPTSLRDIALVVDISTPAKDIVDIIQGFPLVAEANIFDVYVGEQVPRGKKSLAFRITYRSPERTLTDEEVNQVQQQILDRLAKDLGATLR
jgi:phenylalanyl-tRNA synthetase beta chain